MPDINNAKAMRALAIRRAEKLLGYGLDGAGSMTNAEILLAGIFALLQQAANGERS